MASNTFDVKLWLGKDVFEVFYAFTLAFSFKSGIGCESVNCERLPK
jgi:hypothetical protein